MADFIIVLMLSGFIAAIALTVASLVLLVACICEHFAMNEVLNAQGRLPDDHKIGEIQLDGECFSFHRVHCHGEHYLTEEVIRARLWSLGKSHRPCDRFGCHSLEMNIRQVVNRLGTHHKCALLIPTYRAPHWNEVVSGEYAIIPADDGADSIIAHLSSASSAHVGRPDGTLVPVYFVMMRDAQ